MQPPGGRAARGRGEANMRSTIRTTLITLLISGLFATGAALGQAGPALVNYQGVLRDNTDRPLTGSYNMVFYFMSAATSGVEIMIDSHTAAGGNAVTVTGGLFNVTLGGGTVTDGSGGGTYTSLTSVFKDYAAVYLKIVVNGEELSSRPRIVAAAYAMNADLVDGKHATDFSAAVHSHGGGDITSMVSNSDQVDGMHAAAFSSAVHTHTGSQITTAVSNSDMLDGMHESSFVNLGAGSQTKFGPFTADASAVASTYGITGRGSVGGGAFSSTSGSGAALLGFSNTGVQGKGSGAGGYFANDTDRCGASVGRNDYGIWRTASRPGDYSSTRTRAAWRTSPMETRESSPRAIRGRALRGRQQQRVRRDRIWRMGSRHTGIPPAGTSRIPTVAVTLSSATATSASRPTATVPAGISPMLTAAGTRMLRR